MENCLSNHVRIFSQVDEKPANLAEIWPDYSARLAIPITFL